MDGDYDQGGAYWGGGSGDFIYRAIRTAAEEDCELFVRARTRTEAKEEVRETIPNARFYN